ncbi:MAG: hypothetical protein AB8E87_14535, partial [Prochlorococcus sp.]
LIPTNVDTTINAFQFSIDHGLKHGDRVQVDYTNSVTYDADIQDYVTDESSPVTGLRKGVTYAVVIKSDQKDDQLRLAKLATPEDAIKLSKLKNSRTISIIPAAPTKVTTYTRTADNQIREKQLQWKLNNQGQLDLDADGNPKKRDLVDTTVAGTSKTLPNSGGKALTTTYDIANGLTYGWTQGQQKTKTTTTTYKQNSFNLLGFDWDALSKDEEYDSRFIKNVDGSPLLEGEALQPQQPTDSSIGWQASETSYAIQYQQQNTGAPSSSVLNWTTGGGWLRKKTYWTQTTEVQGLKDYWSNYLKADHPIEVGFITPDTTTHKPGHIEITGSGRIQLDGEIKGALNINLKSTRDDIIVNQLLVDDGVPVNIDAANDLSLNIGTSTNSSGINPTLPVSIKAGADATVQVVNVSGTTPDLEIVKDNNDAGFWQAGGTFAFSSESSLRLPSSADAGSSPMLAANWIKLALGRGDLGTSDNPLTLATGEVDGGFSLKITDPDGSDAASSAWIQQDRLNLRLIPSEAGSPAIDIRGDISIDVKDGHLLDSTDLVINPINEANLQALDQRFAFTGPEATTRANEEMAREDSKDYNYYWLNYRKATENRDGSWSTTPSPQGTFGFSKSQRSQLLKQRRSADYSKLTTAEQAAENTKINYGIDLEEQRLQQVHLQVGSDTYKPSFNYSRPPAQQQAYLAQRVVGLNTYYRPLSRELYLNLFPQQA